MAAEQVPCVPELPAPPAVNRGSGRGPWRAPFVALRERWCTWRDSVLIDPVFQRRAGDCARSARRWSATGP